MQRTGRIELDRRAHAEYVERWLEGVVTAHYEMPLVIARAVATADLYGDWVAYDPGHPIGLMPDTPFDSAEVDARRHDLLRIERMWEFPGLIEWDRPWALRTGLAARSEGPSILRLYIGLGCRN